MRKEKLQVGGFAEHRPNGAADDLAFCGGSRFGVPGNKLKLELQRGGLSGCELGRPQSKGVALVITLLMLSVITFMAVAFLAVSRRERASVAGTLSQVDAQAMADAALARAQADMAAYLMANNTNAPVERGRPNDLLNYDMMMSHNFINPAGFTPGINDPTNVNFDYHNDGGHTIMTSSNNSPDWVENIANLLYDPRVPVFVQTNTSLPDMDFRYWVDYNRNGRFESNGLISELDSQGNLNGQTELNYGEPEWIGALRQPDMPHGSNNNTFIGRYAYLVLPIGKTLDINFIHNYAKGTMQGNSAGFPASMPHDGYLRNQGHGPWELNLAALLAGVNSNLWATDYVYVTQAPNDAPATNGWSVSSAYTNALELLRYRYATNLGNLRSLQSTFSTNANNVFQSDRVDEYADGPVAILADDSQYADNDDPNQNWPGSTNYHNFYEPQDFFDKMAGTGFANNLITAGAQNDTTNRYTFSRLLASIGTDSDPELYCWVHADNGSLVKRAKVNINFDNNAAIQVFNKDPIHNKLTTPSVLTNWDSLGFFTNAAELLLRSQDFALITNNINATNLPPSVDFVHFGLTNIMVYSSANTNIHYSATIHRMLQLAANIYDASGNNVGDTNTGIMYPSVFRPQFDWQPEGAGTPRATNFGVYVAATNVYITNWVAVTDTNFVRNPFRSLSQAGSIRIDANDNVWGVPLVVGAKKNLPNFNKFAYVTAFDITRKIKYMRASAAPGVIPDGYQMTLLSISNVFGVEGWNSYTKAFPLASRLYITNAGTVTLSNEKTNFISGYTNIVFQNIGASLWQGNPRSAQDSTTLNTNSFKPFSTNLISLPEAQYAEAKDQFQFHPQDTDYQLDAANKNTFPTHDWNILTTNYVFYLLTDQSTPPHILDVVNIGDFNNRLNVNSNLLYHGVPPRDNPWSTNAVAGNPNPNMKEGVLYQLRVATNGIAAPAQYNPQPGAGAEFAQFLQGQGTNLAKNCPYEPSATLQFKTYFEANDPLVHYTLDDLTSPVLTNVVTYLQPRMATNANLTELGRINEVYSPWNHGTDFKDLQKNMTFKDPMVLESAGWGFPTNKFPSVGWLGRVHRGSPWQTFFLKSEASDSAQVTTDHKDWVTLWEKDLTSYPTNDWRVLDLFTVALNENSARGLLSINQTNLGPWSALLSGVYVLTNNLGGQVIDPTNVAPIVTALNARRVQQDNQVFHHLGDFLAEPSLTRTLLPIGGVLNLPINEENPQATFTGRNQTLATNWDEVVERVPQQVLSLVKLGDPRFVIYSFGQSLKPANNSLVLGGQYRGMCTNYQITGEVVTRAVCRLSNDSTPTNPKIIVESFNILPGN